jgi:hypothetical protein
VALLGSRSVGAQQLGALAGWKDISLLTELRLFEGTVCCYKHLAPLERKLMPLVALKRECQMKMENFVSILILQKDIVKGQ